MLRQSGPRQVEDLAIMRKMPPGGRTLDLLGPPGSPSRATHGTVMTRSPRTAGAAEGEEGVRVVRVVRGVREEQFDVGALAEAVGAVLQERSPDSVVPRHPGADGHLAGRSPNTAPAGCEALRPVRCTASGQGNSAGRGLSSWVQEPLPPRRVTGQRRGRSRVQHEPGSAVRGRSLTGPCQPAVHRRLQRAQADRGRPHGVRRAGLGQRDPCRVRHSGHRRRRRPAHGRDPHSRRRDRGGSASTTARPSRRAGTGAARPPSAAPARPDAASSTSPRPVPPPSRPGPACPITGPGAPARAGRRALPSGSRWAPVPPVPDRRWRPAPRPPASSPLSPPVKGVRATGFPGASRPCGRARSGPFRPPRAPCCPVVPEGRGPLTRTRKLQPLATLVKQA